MGTETKCPDCGKRILRTKGDCENGCAIRCLARVEVDDLTSGRLTQPSPRYVRRLAITAQVAMHEVAELSAETLRQGERVGLLEAELAKERARTAPVRLSVADPGTHMACVVVQDGKLVGSPGHEPWYRVKLQVPNHPSIAGTVCRLCGNIYVEGG